MTTTALDRANSKAQRLERELREARAEVERWNQIAGRLDDSCEALAANIATAWDQGYTAGWENCYGDHHHSGEGLKAHLNPYRTDADA